MRIMLRPQFRPDRYTLARSGPALIIDGTAFDFSQLDDGEFLPREAVSSPWVTDLGITRVGGILQIALILPHGMRPPAETLSPADILNPPDGDIALPAYDRRGTA